MYHRCVAVPQNPRARDMRDNIGNNAEPGADASAAAAAAATREAGEKEIEQGEGRGEGRRFRWVARVASRVSKVGKKARGRVARIVQNEQTAEGQQQEDL